MVVYRLERNACCRSPQMFRAHSGASGGSDKTGGTTQAVCRTYGIRARRQRSPSWAGIRERAPRGFRWARALEGFDIRRLR